jgi:hypothetical protein
VLSGDHEGWAGDELDRAAHVRVADRSKAAGQSQWVHREKVLAEWRDELGVLLQHARREPVCEEHVGDRAHVICGEDRVDLLIPLLGGPQERGGVGQNQSLDPLGGVHAEPLADEAAKRQAAERERLDPWRVQQLDDIRSVVAIEFESTSTGASPGPSERYARRHPSPVVK